MKIMHKKGMSHIEVILAFVLFISSIIAILYFFNFPKDNSNISTNLEDTYSKIRDNLSTDLFIYGVKINDNLAKNLSLNLSTNIKGYRVYAKDYLGNQINASITDNNTGVICLNTNNDLSNFVYIYLNKDITEDPVTGGCTNYEEDKYNISSMQKESLMSVNSALDLKNEYEQNYTALKSYFNLSKETNFGFELDINETDKIIAENNVPRGIEIYAKDYKLNLINDSIRNVLIANLKIKIW